MHPYVVEKNRTYDLGSRLLQDRIVFIDDDIDDALATSVVAQLLYLESVDNDKDICIYIKSRGGVITDAFSIFDTMNYIKPDIITVGMGIVASAASFLAAAGTKGKRYLLPNTDVMIHQPLGGASGQAVDIAIQSKRILYLKDKMINYYSGFTGQDYDTLERDMDRDFYLTAEEAVKYGLADKVEYKRK